jgi:hypothetical protein
MAIEVNQQTGKLGSVCEVGITPLPRFDVVWRTDGSPWLFFGMAGVGSCSRFPRWR